MIAIINFANFTTNYIFLMVFGTTYMPTSMVGDNLF
jgi:hypothetical protein